MRKQWREVMKKGEKAKGIRDEKSEREREGIRDDLADR